MLAFVSDAVADCIGEIEPKSVLNLSSNVIRNFEWDALDTLFGYIEVFSKHEKSREALRHLNATKRVLKLFKNLKVGKSPAIARRPAP